MAPTITLICAFQFCVPKDKTPFLAALDEQSPGEELRTTGSGQDTESRARGHGEENVVLMIDRVCVQGPAESRGARTERSGAYPQEKEGYWKKNK